MDELYRNFCNALSTDIKRISQKHNIDENRLLLITKILMAEMLTDIEKSLHEQAKPPPIK